MEVANSNSSSFIMNKTPWIPLLQKENIQGLKIDYNVVNCFDEPKRLIRRVRHLLNQRCKLVYFDRSFGQAGRRLRVFVLCVENERELLERVNNCLNSVSKIAKQVVVEGLHVVDGGRHVYYSAIPSRLKFEVFDAFHAVLYVLFSAIEVVNDTLEVVDHVYLGCEDRAEEASDSSEEAANREGNQLT